MNMETSEQSMSKNFFDYTHESLTTFLLEEGFSKFNSKQVFDWVYKKKEFNPENWTNISKKLRAFSLESFTFELPEVIWHGLSKDGTRKFLLRMNDKETVESVLIPARGRLTQCVSSQVGCAIGCTFCHTGTQGLKRNLKTHEIVGQYMALTLWLNENVHEEERISNIVFMGQGEPLHNYENVFTSMTII